MSIISMKYLRRFNEELSSEEVNSIEKSFQKAKVSPVTEKLPINHVYGVLFIELSEPLDHPDLPEGGKYMIVDLNYSSYISSHETLDDAVESLTSQGSYDYYDNWEAFQNQNSDKLVNILEYNDINFAEIDNIFTDYNMTVDNMWGLLK
jgi:hypothetical protein